MSPYLKTESAAQRRRCRDRRTLQASVADTRKAISREFSETFLENQHLARLALDEAEAIAWQTGWPHLIFPELAGEKVRALVSWTRRQQSLRHRQAARSTAIGQSETGETLTSE